MKKNVIKVAICYDFDGTLALGNMQEYGFIQALKMTADEFWKQSDSFAKSQKADKNLSYMLTMLSEAKKRNVPFGKNDLPKYGKSITFFKGVESWFSRLNAYARSQGIELQHYMISSGLKEIINGSSIAHEFSKVYACSFLYDENEHAVWPSQVVNYTTKTQYLFRISKGCLEEDDITVNDRMTKDCRIMPFAHMLYIGDGITDIPCMATLKKFGGSAFAVYSNPTKSGMKNALKLQKDGRVDNIAPADYSEGSKMDIITKAWIDKIKSTTDMKA